MFLIKIFLKFFLKDLYFIKIITTKNGIDNDPISTVLNPEVLVTDWKTEFTMEPNSPTSLFALSYSKTKKAIVPIITRPNEK